MTLLRLETLRARLTAWYVAALAVMILVVGGLIYVLLARALYSRIDEGLQGVMLIAMTSLANDLAEGQDTEDAARSTAAELASPQQRLAIYDTAGRLLAEAGDDDRLAFSLPDVSTIPSGDALLLTVAEASDGDDRHRLAIRRVSIPPSGTVYIVVVGSDLEPTDDELQSLREILAYVVPIALVIAGLGGWVLARQSLSSRWRSAREESARRMSACGCRSPIPVTSSGVWRRPSTSCSAVSKRR